MKTNTKKTAVILPAGGSGKRMGLRKPKQYLKIQGTSILEWTLKVFQKHPSVAEIVVVLPEPDVKTMGARLKKRFSKISAVATGGTTRTDSVSNGFSALTGTYPTVLVHDAVRPFVRAVDIDNLLAELRRCDAATLAVPVKDTIKRVKGTRIIESPDRSVLWHTLTPQGFKTSVLADALVFAEKKGIAGTDECMLAEKMGKDVRVVEGHYFNIKITTPEDLVFTRAILKQS